MRLTTFSDYTLRVLMFLALHRDRRVTIAEIAAAYGVSENHLMKVVQHLAGEGLVESARGKGGGLRLLGALESIRIGDVVRRSEGDAPIVECLSGAESSCRVAPVCKLQGALVDAFEALYQRLNQYTLADLMRQPAPFRRALTGLRRAAAAR